jgi:hypothetical protein
LYSADVFQEFRALPGAGQIDRARANPTTFASKPRLSAFATSFSSHARPPSAAMEPSLRAQ